MIWFTYTGLAQAWALALLIVSVTSTFIAVLRHLFMSYLDAKREEAERDTRFVHWAHQYQQPRATICVCAHCEQMRRDFGLTEGVRWRKLTIPQKYL